MAREPMLAWLRPYLSASCQGDAARQPGAVYLLSCVDAACDPLASLRRVCERLFAAELDVWCRDPLRWPQQRHWPVFERWFEPHFLYLVEDVGAEPLRRYALAPGFPERLAGQLDALAGGARR